MRKADSPISTPRKRISPAQLLEQADKNKTQIKSGFINSEKPFVNTGNREEEETTDNDDTPVIDAEQVRPRPERPTVPMPAPNNNNEDIINLKKELQELRDYIILPELRKQYLNRAYKQDGSLFIILKIISPKRVRVQKISETEYITLDLNIISFDDLDFEVFSDEIDRVVKKLEENIGDCILCIK